MSVLLVYNVNKVHLVTKNVYCNKKFRELIAVDKSAFTKTRSLLTCDLNLKLRN